MGKGIKAEDFCAALSILTSLAAERRGVRPRFTRCHMLRALEVLSRHGPMGRPTLMRLLGLGETSTKNMIRRLREQGLVAVDPVGGAYLTPKGHELLSTLTRYLALLSTKAPRPLAPWNCVSVWSIRLVGAFVGPENVIKLRDEAIRAGVEGAVILVKRSSDLLMPTSTGFEKVDILGSYSQLLSDGDLIVIIGSATCREYVHCEAVMRIVDVICRRIATSS